MKKIDNEAVPVIDENNRRTFLRSSAAAASALVLGSVLPATASAKSAPKAGEVELLFVQSADKVVLDKNTLVLSGIAKSTIYFSDRPQRIAGHMLTSDFITDWQKGTHHEDFKQDPPNATLSIISGDEVQDVVMTLTNPRLESDVLLYDVKLIDDGLALDVFSGPGSLFIDIVGMPATPVSVAGVARRERRRVIYR
ncbi:twin-arginine translocation signal domain-containing protein [Colwellia echini]|uniref:Uncharacterized protein n=1 Tax=Colwellia echini TaxID=1982103 RepID=A0ABY3MY73_9GAMM|nr:twin-arginine translocation signal domain-containing protein [Colwellia echini]TYK66139.1 hypothetical protein CWS31_007690 [Colwellia echini]